MSNIQQEYHDLTGRNYNFYTEKLTFMSDPVQDYMHLAPYNTYTNGTLVMLHYKDGMQKTVFRLRLSDIDAERKETLVANLLYSGNIQAFSPNMSTILIADTDKNLNGNIIVLQLK